MNKIENYKIPWNETGQNTLEILMENMKKMDTELQWTNLQNVISMLRFVMSFLLLVQVLYSHMQIHAEHNDTMKTSDTVF